MDCDEITHLDLEIVRLLEESGAESEAWEKLTAHEKNIFLAGMAHARNLVYSR